MSADREGDHAGRFTLPDGRGAHGVLTLARNKPPRLSLHPDSRAPIPAGGQGFPLDTSAESLTGQLHSNHDVVLGDVHLSEWFPSQFLVSARWALVGLAVSNVQGGRWKTLDVQLTGLETVLGNAIAATYWPANRSVDPQRFSADVNTAAHFVSNADRVVVTAQYDTAFSIADRYRFTLKNYASVRFVAEDALTIDEWGRRWIDPLIGLLTLATGEREEVNKVVVISPDQSATRETDLSDKISGELWGGGIHQRDQPAEFRTRTDGLPVVPLFTLDNSPPLAQLLQTWTRSLADETATSLYRLALDSALPLHVRYLLCLQALESIDVKSNAAKEAAADTRHQKRRGEVLAALGSVDEEYLDGSALRFIRNNLRREPLRSLAGRLHRLLKQVPGSEARVGEWTRETHELGAELLPTGRKSDVLHERLASARNALSHGVDVSPASLDPAVRVVVCLLRGALLTRLGFDEAQIATAYDRMGRFP